jgi:hypothetical protein
MLRRVFISLLTLVSLFQVLSPYLLDVDAQSSLQALEIECEKETKSGEKFADIDFYFLNNIALNAQKNRTGIFLFDYSISFPVVTLDNTTPPPELS